MGGKRCKKSSLNKRRIKQNGNSPKRTKCEELAELGDNSNVTQQKINNVCVEMWKISTNNCCFISLGRNVKCEISMELGECSEWMKL